MTQVGPEGCVCGGDHLALPEPGDAWVCQAGQYCYQDPGVSPKLRHSHACVETCQEIPTYNSEPCFCHHQVCNDPTSPNFCYQNSSCQQFEICPENLLYNHTVGSGQNSKNTFNLDFCVCGFNKQTKLCNNSQYCLAEQVGNNAGRVEHFIFKTFHIISLHTYIF